MTITSGAQVERRPRSAGMRWLVALPLLMAFFMGTTTLVLALRTGDAPLPGEVWKQGPVQFGTAPARERAAAARLQVQVQRSGTRLLLEGLPPASGGWELVYWRPGSGGDDLRLELAAGQVQAELAEAPGQRLQVMLHSRDGQFELAGTDPGGAVASLVLQP